jgi:serine acetyltransferase
MTMNPSLDFDLARAGRRRRAVARSVAAFRRDAERVVEVARARGVAFPRLAALGDVSLWALALLRGGAAARAATGSSLGLSQVLRLGFHIDAWTDEIGPGLRLPHPFNVVIGEHASIGAECTLMHNVTVQRGAGTRVGRGAVLGTGAVVLAGARVGDGALIGAASVVRGDVPAGHVAVGAPARVVRPVRPGEALS